MSDAPIPLVDLEPAYREVREPILRAVEQVLDSGQYIGGAPVDRSSGICRRDDRQP